MKINKKSIGIFLVVAIIGSIVLFKFNSKNKNLKSYNILKITLGNGKGYINASGKVEANNTKDVFVDKKLKVNKVFIQEGDFVKKDQLLMTFDDTQRNNIERNLKRKEIQLNREKRNLKIVEKLYEIGGSSINEIKDLKEDIKLLEIDIEEYREDLAKTAEQILSPVSGTISSLKAQENYLVDTDQALLKIMDLSNIKIILEIPEYDIKNVHLNQKLLLKPEVFENKKEFKGEVTKIAKISKTSSTTSENIVEVEVKPLEEIPNIVPGFKVSATIYLDENKNKIIIPKTSILEDNEKYFVFSVNKDGILSKKYINLTSLKGDEVIVLNGLNIGDTILRTPYENLKEGDKILLPNQQGGENKDDNKNSKSK